MPTSSWLKTLKTLLHYRTPKYVEVRSLNLGLCAKAPLLLIFLYIIVYQILYKNRHMGKSQPMGLSRLQLQRPTKEHCNPNHGDCEADYTPLSELDYCNQNGAAGEEVEGKLPCQYMDEKQMNPTGFQHFTLMIPTRITTQRQLATGNCGPGSSHTCTNVFVFNDSSASEESEDSSASEESVYVADVERFTLLIETAFTLPSEDQRLTPVRRGSSIEFPGYWEVCEDTRFHRGCSLERIPCLTSGCDGKEPESSDRRLRRLLGGSIGHKDEAQVERRLGPKGDLVIFGLAVGDVISMGSLLTLAGVDLDKDTDLHGESRRSAGIALQVDVQFDNNKPFKWPPWRSSREDIKYVYHVSTVPFQTYKEVSQKVVKNGKERVLIDKHGIFVNVNIRGSVLFFDPMTTLLILTTTLSLMAGTNFAVHFCAANLWKNKEEYKKSKTDRSRNFDKRDKICFCLSIPSIDESADQNWAHYTKDPHQFTEDLQALEGETLRCAGDLLMALHRIHADKEEPGWRSVDSSAPLMPRSF